MDTAITTAFDMRVQNELDRFHLAMDVIDRVPGLGSKGAYLKQAMTDKLVEHKHYVDKHVEDLPGIRNWVWGQNSTATTAKRATAKLAPPTASCSMTRRGRCAGW